MKVEIIFIIVGAFVALLGVIIKHLRLYNLIAGYNTMPIKDKITFNIESFSTIMRNVFLIIGLLIILSSLINLWLNIDLLCPIVAILTILFGVIYLNIQGSRIKNRNKS